MDRKRKYYLSHKEEIKRKANNWKKNHPNYMKDYYQKHKDIFKKQALERYHKMKDDPKYKKLRKKIDKKHWQKIKSSPFLLEKKRRQEREALQKLRMKIYIHYGGDPPKCACCGEVEFRFLSLDHIHGGGNKHRKKVGGNQRIFNWLIRNNYPEGYQVLCYNCNCGRARNNGVCPHEERK